VINIDLVENKEADFNTVATGSGSLSEQGHAINESLSTFLGSEKLCAIFCVAGGWAGGNAGSKGNRKKTTARGCDIHMYI
jgi:dihydropteridine reductase